MAEIQGGPWSGVLRGSPTGLPAASTHSAWRLSVSDLEMLQKTMLSLLTDPALSDVCLLVEGIEVPSHKAVLAAWSRPFRAMFTLPMLESRHQCRVVIEDAEHGHLMVVLHYLYGGRIGLNDENVIPVSALANRYEVLPLVAQCEGYMKKRLNPSNVCQQLLAAEEHRVPKASAFALDFLAVHFDEVHHDCSGDFNCLSGDTVLHVLQHGGLTADEETIFLAVDGWAKAWERRRAIRGATPNFAVGRSPPPAVAEPSTQTPGGTSITNQGSPSSSHSVKKTLSATDFPLPNNVLQEAQDTIRQRSGGVGNGAGATERTQETATSRSETNGPSMMAPAPPLAVAVSVPAVSAAVAAGAAAGAAAAARRKAEKEQQHATLQQPLVAAAAAATTAAGVSVPSRGTHADDTAGSPSSPDSARSTSPTLTAPIAALGTGGRGGWSGGTGQLSTVVVGEELRKGETGGGVHGVLQRRASGPAGGNARRGRCVRSVLERAASFPDSPPRPEGSVGIVATEAAVVASRGSSVATDTVVDPGMEALEMMASMPEEERAFVDELLMEVRFPLISTSFLCQVAEKSPAISGSRVAQRLLHEAYRFQAMTSADAVDVDEHFPGNHRVKYRGHERVLFGEGDGCVGTVDDFSSSLSEVHLVDNVKRRDEKYWLPGQPEEAYFCVRLDRVRRVTKVRFQNRYSEEFEVAVRRTLKEEWQVVVPHRVSGGHKDIQEINLTRKRVKARHIKISLRGRKRSCYNTSCYWTELLGF